jgi:hypothetical protein
MHLSPRFYSISLVVVLSLLLGATATVACSPSGWQPMAAKVATFTPTAAVTAAITGTTITTVGPTVTPPGDTVAAASDEVASPTEAPPPGTGTPVVVTYRTPDPTRKPTATPTARATTPTPTPTATVIIPERAVGENPLTGEIVADPGVLQRRPVHVRVGNDPAARPQAGLGSADLVYEEIVEWWVTRFTAVYLSTAPEVVAPIRSARLINTQLTQQYQAALVNSGGSDGVRWELSQAPLVNLDEYFFPQPYFYREGEGWQTRLAVNVQAAHQLMVNKNLEKPVVLRGFTFSQTPLGGQPAETIFIPYPRRTSQALWRYDAASGRYLRWTQGEKMVDSTTSQQISAANVILYYAPHEPTDIVEDSNGATSIRILVNGEGRVQVCRDGVVIEGIWRTDGSQTPEFLFPNGQPIPLKPGNSWIEVVPTEKFEVLINVTPTPTPQAKG